MTNRTKNSPTFNSRRENVWRRNQNTVAFEHTAKLGPVSHTVLIAMMVATLGMIYLTQITKTSTYGYSLEKLNNQKTELIAKKSELIVENARLQSLQKVQSSEVAAKLSTPASTDYVRN